MSLQTAAESKKMHKVVEMAKDDLKVPWMNHHEIIYHCTDPESMAKVSEILWSIKCNRESFPRRALKRLIDGHLIGLEYPWDPRG